MSAGIRSIDRRSSKLSKFLDDLQEQFSGAEEAIYNPETSAPGLHLGGLATQSIDDLNEIVGSIRMIQLSALSILERIEEHIAPRKLKLVEDTEENNCLTLGFIEYSDGQRILPAAVRRIVVDAKK